jgi:hypothetical protein
MLPKPVSFGKQRAFRRFVSPRRRVLDVLLTRSRATNLAVVLLCAVCAASLLSNLYLYATSWPKLPQISSAAAVFSTVHRPHKHSRLNHLIVVPCHAIWRGVDAASRLDEDDWVLEPYQKGSKRIAAFYDHIAQGYRSRILHCLNALKWTLLSPGPVSQSMIPVRFWCSLGMLVAPWRPVDPY